MCSGDIDGETLISAILFHQLLEKLSLFPLTLQAQPMVWVWLTFPGMLNISKELDLLFFFLSLEKLYSANHVPACWVASVMSLFVTLWAIACQAPLSMGFSRQKDWNGLSCPSPEDLPNRGTKPMSLTSPELAGRFFTTIATWETNIEPFTPALHANYRRAEE